MNTSAINAGIVNDSASNDNYRSRTSTFLNKPPFIAKNMRVRTARTGTRWIRGDRAIYSTPSVCMKGKGGIT
jgi:hypothetical protein